MSKKNTEATASTEAATPVAEKPAKITQNNVSRPGVGTTTGRIWEIADTVSAQLKAPAPRADVMKQAEAEGINKATAATQYGKWCKFNGLKAELKAPKEDKPKTEKAPKAPKAKKETAAPVAAVE